MTDVADVTDAITDFGPVVILFVVVLAIVLIARYLKARRDRRAAWLKSEQTKWDAEIPRFHPPAK